MYLFQKFNIIANDDDIPSRNTISGSALSDVYESMLNKVKENIVQDAASHFAVTFDLWTDQYRRLNYITFKLHYLTSGNRLQTLQRTFQFYKFLLIFNKHTEKKDRLEYLYVYILVPLHRKC